MANGARGVAPILTPEGVSTVATAVCVVRIRARCARAAHLRDAARAMTRAVRVALQRPSNARRPRDRAPRAEARASRSPGGGLRAAEGGPYGCAGSSPPRGPAPRRSASIHRRQLDRAVAPGTRSAMRCCAARGERQGPRASRVSLRPAPLPRGAPCPGGAPFALTGCVHYFSGSGFEAHRGEGHGSGGARSSTEGPVLAPSHGTFQR